MNEAASCLTSLQQEQLVQEHCKVFGLNNAIVSSFRVSPLDWPLAVFRTARTMPGRVQLVLVLFVVLCTWALASLCILLSLFTT